MGDKILAGVLIIGLVGFVVAVLNIEKIMVRK